jgi:hypothetical protein
MVRSGRRMVTRSRALLAWTLALAVASQVALGVYLRRAHPELRDPEYGFLVRTLEDRLAEAPGRPLVLFLGSSRVANAVRPAAVPAGGTGPAPLVFNFATTGTGPLRQLQMLRRVLDRGIRPAWVVAEVWPPFLTPEKSLDERGYILARDLQWADGPLLARYVADPWPAFEKLLEGEVLPATVYGQRLLTRYGPFAVRTEVSLFDWADPVWRAEGCGWLPSPVPQLPPELFRFNLAKSRKLIRKFVRSWAVAGEADDALHDLLGTCAGHGIRVALVMVPEHSSLRACYSRAARARLNEYLGGLSREQRVPVIDARDWVADDDFLDLTHVLPRAADPFTQRLGREVLLPLLAGLSPEPPPPYPHEPGAVVSSPGRHPEAH